MTLAQALAKRIDELLEQSNLTQYQLAKRSGLAQTTIADIRKMRNNGTNVLNLNAIAQGFGMDLCEFFNSPLFKAENISDWQILYTKMHQGKISLVHFLIAVIFRLYVFQLRPIATPTHISGQIPCFII